jgi:hypothetical protein
MRSFAALGIFPVEDDTHDMVHFSHSHDEGADKVEAGFFAPSARDFVLRFCVFPGDFGDWREEEMSTVGEPVDLSTMVCQLQMLDKQKNGCS